MQINEETLTTQKTFRILLQAMSHPGRLYSLSPESIFRTQEIKLTWPRGVTLILQTLLDHEVGFCVIGKEKKHIELTISELTGSPAKSISDADFIIIPDGKSNREILKAKRGTHEYPDTGATVIYVVESLNDRDNIEASTIALLKGPGIRNNITVAVQGLGRNELSCIKEINSEFPLGVDCVFIDSTNKIMCIPRSAKIEVM